ncbi:hypothetical protein [Pontiella sulfatireligans]|uniref:Uncharacterized protein n=1 Tax=Pontiella sulfatireligans TaxID=2750658 RepID=A0A6C2UR50_9BACT|nr:hypothetical protein [Pontiella sulfatireligans]VGO22790.1 hypothetical protein SCARR_04887 [Pontiella sulfatireligans]
MKHDIEWVEKLEDRIKRKVRITFHGPNNIKWQFKRSDEEFWDYDTPPTAEDWNALEEKIDTLYHRRRQPYKHLELVRKQKKEAGL